MTTPVYWIIYIYAKKINIDRFVIKLSLQAMCILVLGLFLVLNWMQWVSLTFVGSKFILNHLFTQLQAVTILVWKSFILGLLTNILVTSANSIGIVLSFGVLGRSLI
jgi:hypothetical protein